MVATAPPISGTCGGSTKGSWLLAGASMLTSVRGDLAIIIWLLALKRLARMPFRKELCAYLKELVLGLDGSIARVFGLAGKA